ncbi:Rne/Rng family ribonuclease [Geobacter sp. DSM 9736]|uniref:Rne/Rng family ribonuclease n=1 Tax=Geobacter sp. DSM 9736 TaxID=1277350 RepID=UPI000B50342E|nr:Rne/Rng family ribonuclease [Geobacter sp. DSM 9736]
MARKMLINVMHPEEARVAIVEDGRLVELDIEIAGSEQTRGNVYKGVVVRVEPGLQAAFIDIGLKKLGFLQMGELHPDCWQWRDDIPEEQRKRRPRIQEVLRRGQELIVQVEKGERDNKGAALTTYLSLPGRYMVIMPGSDSAGISRKVESESERKKLKSMAAEMEIPEGIGYIIRTEALGRKKTEMMKDLGYLMKLYESIQDKGAVAKAPSLIYQESGLVIRTIRDYFTAEIDEVLVDSKEVYKQARAFFKATMPKYEKIVKMHQEKRPIFSRYQLEEQIDLIYEKKVPLRSGGSIFIEPTEALVSIDVNSGKSTGEKGVEDTAFKTNLEAAEEAARQLRLRDLGGLIVIDFIDMRDRKHNAEVEKTLKNALKADKARVTVGKISQFGLLEMSRQRIKPTLEQGIHLECPHCSGRGKVKSTEAMALSFLRKVHGAAAKGTVGEVRGALPLDVTYFLLNRKKRDLAQIEDEYEIEVTVKGKPSFLMNQLELELVKREKPLSMEVSETPLEPVQYVAEEGEEDEETAVAETAAPEGEGKKKKRRRGKKKPRHEADIASELPQDHVKGEVAAPAVDEAPVELAAVPGAAAEAPAGEPGLEEMKKKRRRRKRRSKHAQEAAVAPVEMQPQTPVEQEPTAAPSAGEEETHEEVRKKRRRKRRRGKRPTEEGAQVERPDQASNDRVPFAPVPEQPVAAEVAVTSPAQITSVPTVEAVAPPSRTRRPRKKGAESPEASTADVAPEPATAPEVPATRPSRRKKTAAPVAGEESQAPAEKAPARKRTPRKKKSEEVSQPEQGE